MATIKSKQVTERDTKTVRVFNADADRIERKAREAERNSKLQLKRILDINDIILEATGGLDDLNIIREVVAAYKSKAKS